jgi:hypothetical protein
MKTVHQRHRTIWDWRLKLYPLIVIPMMVYLNATGGEVARGVIRDDAHGTSPEHSASHEGIVSETAGSIPVPVAPVQGVDAKGAAYVCLPVRWPVEEFCWFLTKEGQ